MEQNIYYNGYNLFQWTCYYIYLEKIILERIVNALFNKNIPHNIPAVTLSNRYINSQERIAMTLNDQVRDLTYIFDMNGCGEESPRLAHVIINNGYRKTMLDEMQKDVTKMVEENNGR